MEFFWGLFAALLAVALYWTLLAVYDWWDHRKPRHPKEPPACG